jgi:aconitate hydratase
MGPEYGATCGFFPVDHETLAYLKMSGREEGRIALVEAYSKAQGLFREKGSVDPEFTDTLALELAEVVPSLAGPKRPEGRVSLDAIKTGFETALAGEYKKPNALSERYKVDGRGYDLGHGDVVIAAITSCTNTSNPSVLIAAGLLARNAIAKGLKTKPWVKTSLAPGSQVVAAYLAKAGLQPSLDALGFNIVGFGCTTCIGNSGPLQSEISKSINDNGIIAAAVLSGNRNFEGRVSPDTQANYLASPPLVVAFALAGSVHRDLSKDALGLGSDGRPVYLADIWPTNKEVAEFIATNVTREVFLSRYADVFKGDANWQGVKTSGGLTYGWNAGSTYVQNPPYFDGITMTPKPIGDVTNARILALLGDKITTDHISPAGNIKKDSPAGAYLLERQVRPADFNQYGTRRGNHDVMMRGTFANIRIKNAMNVDDAGRGLEGGSTRHYPSGKTMPIFDAAEKYKAEGVPLVIFAGIEYGNGSSRDWAAKGTNLLGVKAVVAQSFERIHRSNLVGMGVLPLVFEDGLSWASIGLKGDETVTIPGLANVRPRMKINLQVTGGDGVTREVPTICRIDTEDEINYYRHGGILHFVLRNLAASGA